MLRQLHENKFHIKPRADPILRDLILPGRHPQKTNPNGLKAPTLLIQHALMHLSSFLHALTLNPNPSSKGSFLCIKLLGLQE